MNILKFGTGLLAATSLILGSCTIHERDKEPTEPGSARLKTITLYGSVMTSLSYDSNGRLTNIGDLMTASRLKISYSPLTMVYEGYHESYFDMATLTEKITWSNIKTNADGYIISADIHSEEYDFNDFGEDDIYIDNGASTYTYDSQGHLQKIEILYTDGILEVTDFVWKDGLLTQMTLDEDYYQIYTYENALPNINYQWIIYWGDLFYFSSGLLGKAPSKYISTIQDFDHGYPDNYADLHYQLNEAGYVSSLQMLEDMDGSEYVKFSFNYESTRGFEEPLSQPETLKKLSVFKRNPFIRHTKSN